MQVSDDDLRTDYQRATAGRRLLGGCPGDEVLVSAAARSASASDRVDLSRHLADCSDCAVEYRVLRAVSPFAERLADRLESAGSSDVDPAGPFERESEHSNVVSMPVRDRAPSSSPVWLAVAAVLGALSLALGLWLAQTRSENRDLQLALDDRSVVDSQLAQLQVSNREQESRIGELEGVLEQLRQPQANFQLVDLMSSQTLRGGGGSGDQELALGPGDQRFGVILHTGSSSGGSATVEVHRLAVDAAGAGVEDELVWRQEGLVPDAYNTLTLSFPASLFPAGTYRLALRSSGGERETYDLVVQGR